MTINAWRMLAGYPIIGSGILANMAWGDGGELSLMIAFGAVAIWLLSASLIKSRRTR